MKNVICEQFDIVVIGAGPAGMLAAIRAAQNGRRVAIVDKKEEPGKKLLMAGGGRCNLTQAEEDLKKLALEYKNGRFLQHAFRAFGPKRVRDLFATMGIETKEEKNGRVFPISDKGQDVLDVLQKSLKENNVTFLLGHSVEEFVTEQNKIVKIVLKKRELLPEKVIIATGGMSYPATGSTGDGFKWAKQFGHNVIKPEAALVPIQVQEQWIDQLQGVSLSNVSLAAYCSNKKQFEQTGDLMLTHYGLSGPLALNLSRRIGELAKGGVVKIAIDLKPYLSIEQLDQIVQKDFERHADKKLSNCLGDLFTPKLLEFLLTYSGLDLKKHAANISRKERRQLVNLFKNFQFTFDELLGFERAMVTTGGISTKEVESKTMKSKIVDNLFFAGEILDVDGPTGGYNLQMCWSTGFLAGESASKNTNI